MKNVNASSNLRDARNKTEGTSVNAKDGHISLNGNAISQDKERKNHQEKVKSLLIIKYSIIKHTNEWGI